MSHFSVLRGRLHAALLGAALVVGVSGPAAAGENWAVYSAPDYGFSMLVPQGVTLVESEGVNGWARLVGTYDGLSLYALTKRGEQASPAEIAAVGIALTGIPASRWATIDSGENQGGWHWYETVEASQNGTVIFGGYGTGPSGSYLLLLQTTESDYIAYRSDYLTWYNSIRLF